MFFRLPAAPGEHRPWYGGARGGDDSARAVAAVAAANRLTARWADSWDGGGTVLSGVGAWPLLAALSEAASGAARDELADAAGVPGGSRLDGAHDVLRVLDRSLAVHYALGLWTAASLPVKAQ